MPKLFVYRIVTDTGVAPHISKYGLLSLTLCKPGIRQAAKVGDYVLALVALQHKKITGLGSDRFFKAAYLFKVTEISGILDYEEWCKIHAPDKICTNDAFEMCNCQYNKDGVWRLGPHDKSQKNRDLGGKFSLISNHYAAWTSEKAFTLSGAIMDSIGLDQDQVKKATRNYFRILVDKEEQIAALEELINGMAVKSVTRCVGKNCSKRKTRKNNVSGGTN
jgi:hypothetical protein